MAEEANVIDEIDAANEANLANEANGANEAIDTNEAIDAKEAEVDEADEADEASVADEANSTGISGKADVTDLLLPFSLTKYSVFVVEAKGYFGINNNQLGGPFGRNDIDNQLGTVYIAGSIEI